MPDRFSEVEKNKIYRGGAPTPDEIPLLKKVWNVEQIISLDQDVGEKIHPACVTNDIKHIFLPVEWNKEKDNFNKVLSIMNSDGVTNIIGDKVSYVHCMHGKDRTGMFIARYRTENGWSAKKAVEEAMKFGFGTFLDDKVIKVYLSFINNGKNSDRITLSEYKDMMSTKEFCDNCGMLLENDKCENCTGNMNASKKDVVDRVRDDMVKSEPNMSQDVSDLWSTPDYINASNETKSLIRKGLISTLNKYIVAMDLKNISQPVTDEKKKKTEELIKKLDAFTSVLDILVENQVTKMLNLFENNQGITYEMLEEIGVVSHFNSFGKNLKKNIWRLVGNYFKDTIEDLMVDDDYNENFYSLFELCLDGLNEFSKDTDLGPMRESFRDAMKGLVDIIIDLDEFIVENLKSENMQTDITEIMQEIQKQTAKVKSLVKERIADKLAKDVLGRNKIVDKDESLIKKVLEQKRRRNNNGNSQI